MHMESIILDFLQRVAVGSVAAMGLIVLVWLSVPRSGEVIQDRRFRQ